MRYWTLMACGTVLAFALALFVLAWLLCGLIVIGGLEKRTWRRVLFAFTVGPLLLRNRGFTR